MIEQLQFLLEKAFSQDSITLYFLMFGGGLLASLTPCTYPVLPLTVGYIGNRAGGNRTKAFVLSLAMLIGMALVYAILGSIVAAVGGTFGSIMGSGWALYLVALYFMIMGLFLMGVFHFPVPGFICRLQAKSVNRRGMFGAFVVGGFSGLICGPCTGPILAVALGAIAFTLKNLHGVNYAMQIVKGGFLLFLFGLGQGVLILLAGIFTGFISKLPEAGAWMETVKKGFALLIIITSTLLFVLVGQNTDFPNLAQLLARTETPSARLAGSGAPSASQIRASEKPLTHLAPDFTLPSLEGEQVALSKIKAGKGAVLVFFATWCVPCVREVAEIKQFAEMAQKENIVVLGINFKQKKEIVERLRKSEQIKYEILLDTNGIVTTEQYGIKGIPHIVGINAKDEIIYRGVALPEKRDEFMENLKRGS